MLRYSLLNLYVINNVRDIAIIYRGLKSNMFSCSKYEQITFVEKLIDN